LLIKINNTKFHAIDARCSHEGGPLDEGDIEEIHNKLVIICPWHFFDFDIESGESSTGLRQQIYETKIADSCVYINTPFNLKLETKSYNKQKKEEIKKDNTYEKQLVEMIDEKSMVYWAVKVLRTADSIGKANLTNSIYDKWKNGDIEIKYDDKHEIPEQPYRTDDLKFVDPSKIRRGKGGTLVSKVISRERTTYEMAILFLIVLGK
jgi:nitrite reductase/ring-hydroxylating ferredoxin subunit